MTGKGYKIFLTQTVSAVMAIHYCLHIFGIYSKEACGTL